MRTPNTFENPANSDTYEWPINHARDGEEQSGISRAIDHTATTGQTNLVLQQGADEPLTFSYSGTILERSQHLAFVAWARLCRTQSIYFTDFAGNEHEVVITSYTAKRVGVTRNPRDLTNAPLNKWEFTMHMEVLNVLSGDWS